MALPDTSLFPESASIVARWKLDEENGNRADSVGANTLTDNNSVLSGAGISLAGASSVYAADFEHANAESLSRADNAALSITGDMTLATWLNFETVPNGAGTDPPNYVTIAGKWTAGSRGWELSYRNYAGEPTRLVMSISSNGSSDTQKYVSWTPSAATWYRLMLAYDASAGTCDVYVGGSSIGQMTSLPTSIYDSTAAFIIGATSLEPFDGMMQDFFVWNSFLSSADAAADNTLYTTAPAVTWIDRGTLRGVMRGVVR